MSAPGPGALTRFGCQVVALLEGRLGEVGATFTGGFQKRGSLLGGPFRRGHAAVARSLQQRRGPFRGGHAPVARGLQQRCASFGGHGSQFAPAFGTHLQAVLQPVPDAVRQI